MPWRIVVLRVLADLRRVGPWAGLLAALFAAPELGALLDALEAALGVEVRK